MGGGAKRIERIVKIDPSYCSVSGRSQTQEVDRCPVVDFSENSKLVPGNLNMLCNYWASPT